MARARQSKIRRKNPRDNKPTADRFHTSTYLPQSIDPSICRFPKKSSTIDLAEITTQSNATSTEPVKFFQSSPISRDSKPPPHRTQADLPQCYSLDSTFFVSASIACHDHWKVRSLSSTHMTTRLGDGEGRVQSPPPSRKLSPAGIFQQNHTSRTARRVCYQTQHSVPLS